ncbi:LysR family transcriptional regulator [Labrenzia sp. PHM005]|uniref:LysR family transcriptional regulator n=1 Tax=Labrenzia sp. PHM005 TaxID=2590016 RepID=UPI0011408809|nr:LysR family transcriptional regulator [Labrenzia sp. PHM005]QDG78831.1 LysR family transcriptional regulator [Labrenzia sp. PHM005]
MNSQDIPLVVARALRLIAETGSVSDAARALGVTQPAVSKSIAQLEKRFGVAFLVRGSRPLTLTDEGSALAQYAQQADLLQDKALRHLDDVRKNRTGTVRLGSFGSSASFHILPKLLGSFALKFPGIAVEILEFPDEQLQAVLREGGVDAAILADPDVEDLEIVPLAADQLVALVPDHHKLADKVAVQAADFGVDPFILTKGGSAPLVEKWFAVAGIAPQISHTILQVNSILALVKAGLGNSIIAELAVPEHPVGVRVLPLSPSAPRSIVLARRETAPRSKAAQSFWQFCESQTLAAR